MATLANSTIPNGGTLGSVGDPDAMSISSAGIVTFSQGLYPDNFVGLIAGFAMTTVPTGWLLCNGASLSTSSYSKLFAKLSYTWGGSGGSFNIPDLRGEFLRNFDEGRGADPGRSFATYQGYALQGHNHFWQSWAGYQGTGDKNPNNRGYGHNGPFGNSVKSQTLTNQPGYPTASWAPETRPRNKTLNYCIKY